jgi:hypothetical protein
MANNIGVLVGLVSLGMNAFQLVIMFFILHSISYISTVASVIACLVALVVVKRMIIDMRPTHSKCCCCVCIPHLIYTIKELLTNIQ